MKIASSDPRLSIEERYSSFAAYSSAVEKALDNMIAKRLLLPEDRAANLNRLLRMGTATGAFASPTSARNQP